MEYDKASLKTVHQLFIKGEYEEAQPILESLVKAQPDFLLYQLKLKECQSKLNNANTLLKQAETALGQQDHVKALENAKLAIEADKNCHKAYKIAEQAAIELSLFDEAKQLWLSQPATKITATPITRQHNPALPKQFVLPPVIGAGNDYRHILEQASIYDSNHYTKTVSIIMPVYNRHQILANTLAALTHQTYPKELMQIIVVDDGSHDEVLEFIKKYEPMLPIYYARQIDDGYRLAAARNMGLKLATGEAIIFMDADILPYPKDIESYMQVLHVTEQAVLIGHRRYVDVSKITDDMVLADISVATNLPSINPNNDVADRKNTQGVSIDWRYPVYEKTHYLTSDLWPFTKAAGGNIAFARILLDKAGYVDEDFQAWGCEDGEHGYRLYNIGAYFIPMLNIECLHQEPLDEIVSEPATGESFRAVGHKITKQILARKCPAPIARKQYPDLAFEVPKVSIYIPVYNAENYIIDAVQSCLDQDFDDLEVCICNDGSTDQTLERLEQHFSDNPKVRWFSQPNGGIGKATNAAIAFCRGMYIGQLDADDRLKPEAVRTCVSVLDKTLVDAVYSDYDFIDEQGNGNYVRDGWCGGHFSHDWMLTGMLASHFRMFRKRIVARANIQCDEQIKNAIDFDFWSKISEAAHIQHIHQVLYSYRWHGQNTSIQHRKVQEKNHLKVVANSFKRRQIDTFWIAHPTHNPLNPREIKIIPIKNLTPVQASDVIFLIPIDDPYAKKTEAIRQTWANQLKDKSFRYFFLVGDPKLKFSQVIEDLLYVPCTNYYESQLLKLALGYQFLYTHFDFQYVYKLNDDCYPNIAKIISEILPQLAGKQYVAGVVEPKNSQVNVHQHFEKCSHPKFNQPFQFSTIPFAFAKAEYGYFLRKDILPVIFEHTNLFRDELNHGVYSYEDIKIAELLNKREIIVEPLDHYNISSFEQNIAGKTLVYDIKTPNILKKIQF
ncbi:glycosyltransferase [Candidatus Albibeggiatoa sp. nov. NOAA]|uniref:glycosyltransferase n=1 Tax=Candidatus Albibeggiatoa sp. nov. NOAA TaxID=3162724 RepID=UPI0032FD421A|nr:glycosyltransferase [Thiotrichaceae bacterium]